MCVISGISVAWVVVYFCELSTSVVSFGSPSFGNHDNVYAGHEKKRSTFPELKSYTDSLYKRCGACMLELSIQEAVESGYDGTRIPASRIRHHASV